MIKCHLNAVLFVMTIGSISAIDSRWQYESMETKKDGKKGSSTLYLLREMFKSAPGTTHVV